MISNLSWTNNFGIIKSRLRGVEDVQKYLLKHVIDWGAFFGRHFEPVHSKIFREFLHHLRLHLNLLMTIELIADDGDDRCLIVVGFVLQQHLAGVVERGDVAAIVNVYVSFTTCLIWRDNGSKALLSCSVPNLYSVHIVLILKIFHPEIYSDCRDIAKYSQSYLSQKVLSQYDSNIIDFPVF